MLIEQLHHKHHSGELHIDHWAIKANQHWVVFAASGQCIQCLAPILQGETLPTQGQITQRPVSVAWVSLSEQQCLLEEEIANDDSDFLDKVDQGSSVECLIQALNPAGDVDSLLTLLDLQHLRQRGFRALSTGETRRVMLARALIILPELLILDDPFSGLDKQHHHALSAILSTLSTQLQLIIITPRHDELPECMTHVALFDDTQLTHFFTRQQWLQHPLVAQLQAQSALRSREIVDFICANQQRNLESESLVKLTNGSVQYSDQRIFSQVNWEIKPGQHWQIRGPNGCGKSTLLAMIFGDHPQCYSNDIVIFGMKRGSGETVWEIKKHIGMVSSALHLQYRVNCTALEVVLSGYYDSIGLYENPSIQQVTTAKQWLELFGMATLATVSFRQLEYGQQRLLLIIRALIKKPKLVILDEPYQGLDFLNRHVVFHALEMIAKQKLGQLLYVSHYREDALPSINHFVDFIKTEEGDYEVKITHTSEVD